jgi:hypothetical protein
VSGRLEGWHKVLDFGAQTCHDSLIKQRQAMRKIEKLMNDAITASKDWKLDNTEVVNEDGVSTVFLHGNKIAEVGDTWLRLFDGGRRSNTVKSRLNAILSVHGAGFDAIFQKKFEWFFHDSMRSMAIPFESGMEVV